MELSVRQALRGKRLLVTGASGFLGKVWLVHLLEALPELGRVTCVLRPGAEGATGRLEDLLATSPAFWPLHERRGDALPEWLAGRLAAVPGDVARPELGLAEADLERLAGRVDAVVHLAGLTDLEPDLRSALAVNVDGARHALAVARRLGAPLLHVSTAYVAGRRRGRIAEAVAAGAPVGGEVGERFDPRRELEDLRRLAGRVEAEARDQRVEDALLERARAALGRLGRSDDPVTRGEFLAREREAWVAERLAAAAAERARHWGWPNVYTLTKALAEAALRHERGAVPLAIVRPTIVESALALPFPGWKEGHQTSAPLVLAMLRGALPGVPARGRLVLDAIPVDWVARGLTLCLAALVRGEGPEVAHLGTSDRNPLTVRRAIELTNLARRAAEGRAGAAGPPRLRDLLAREAAPTGELGYRLGSAPLARRVTSGARAALEAAADALPGAWAGRARRLARDAGRSARRLGDVEAAVATFRPFLAEHDQTFAADAVAALAARLPAAEAPRFGVDVADLDWRDYWTRVHVPGLERWVFPRLEGQAPVRGPRRPVALPAAPDEVPARP